MSTDSTIVQLLSAGGATAPAIAAPSLRPLTYGELRAQVESTVARLNDFGVGRDDRVAIVLPNGPEMATAFVGIAAGASAAPLNPAYRSDEFEFYLSDLGAKALVVEQGSQSPARQVAERLGVLVLELNRDSERGGAGAFTLHPATAVPRRTGPGGFAEAGDVALLLHTSGTTSRPKLVPLTQRNMVASARSIRATLDLAAEDRGLNIMPLFHIHGLMAGLLAPLAAGGQVFCTSGFNALKFFGWMDEARPTWYTAVPTMHQAILARAAHNREIIAANPLRFVRSSSSSMPPQVIAELEATFRAPLIESYGMTEAAHQMASKPLPPGRRIPGTVGLAAGPDVAIMDDQGDLLPPGQTGEIVIRGATVTRGYEKNPAANAAAFRNGWFRTGDQGTMSAERYITITGRLKEIINRGGEKISPREVDEALMEHPAVLQAVAFALPHELLGEDVAAAIVLREGASASEQELRAHLAERLAPFKTPKKILFLAEIP
ncbi:MAG: AMP-binding protein, partial [Acidobacteria bacterium]|nr:AMP-binding protein [Acidobacteriota bacterium]